MKVKCIYVCNLSNEVMKEKQIHGCVLLSDKDSCEIIIICRPCFLIFEAVFSPEFFSLELRKFLIEVYLKNKEIDFLVLLIQLTY